MAQMWREMEQDRLARMAVNAQFLADRAAVRDDVTVKQARDVMLVLRQGWSLDQFGRFTGEAMVAALLPPT